MASSDVLGCPPNRGASSQAVTSPTSQQEPGPAATNKGVFFLFHTVSHLCETLMTTAQAWQIRNQRLLPVIGNKN